MNALQQLKGKNRIIRAAAYARFSSDNQRDESIDAQLRAIRDYAVRNDVIIVKEYVDRAKSAMTDNRPSFLDMVKESADGEFDILIVHKLDRFARNRYDSAHYNHQLKKNGVQLVSVIEQIDDSPEGRMMMAVLEGMAEFYSQNLAREVRKGMHENALKCIHTGGLPPLGYDVHPETRKLILNETESEIVRLIFRRALDGVGYGEIVNELNRLGFKTKRGQIFSKNSIHTILVNEKYTGTYIFNKSSPADVEGKRNSHKYKDPEDIIRVEDAVPQIISKEDFARMQEIMLRRKKQFVGHKVIETYLLSGKIICGTCGGKYCGNRRKDGRSKNLVVRYCCNTKQRKGKIGCSSKDIRREYIEALVLDELARNIFDESLLPVIAEHFNEYHEQRSGGNRKAMDTAQKTITRLDKDIDALIALLTKTSSKALLLKLEQLETEKVEAEQTAAQLQSTLSVEVLDYQQIKAIFDGAKKMFAQSSLNGLQNLIDTFVEKIVLYDDRAEIKFTFKKSSPSPNQKSKISEKKMSCNPLPTDDGKTPKTPLLSHSYDVSSAENTYWRGGAGATMSEHSNSSLFSSISSSRMSSIVIGLSPPLRINVIRSSHK